ncbi:MAG: alpha-ketoacid dehydrogenase subunit beta [Planctomycetota bacterium]|jgi:pyruvate dehydrogenase E1 component beta subunit
MRTISFTEALNEGLREEMRRDPAVYLLGLGLHWSGDRPSVTAGLYEEFGEQRVRSTPVSEAAVAGSCVGAALAGMRPVAQLALADFVFCALDEILCKAGKWRYTHGAEGGMTLPIVFLETIGGYVSGASEHSQSPLGLYAHAPGLKIAVPTTPYDAKGLLKTAIREDNPVVFFQHKRLMATRGPVPEEDYSVPFGVAKVRRAGGDVTVIATSYMVTLALRAASSAQKRGVDVEVIDALTLEPLDTETFVASVRKTGRLVVVDEDTERCGIGAEIAMQVMERAFEALQAPIQRVGNPNLPVPYSPPLEQAVLPCAEKIEEAILRTLAA